MKFDEANDIFKGAKTEYYKAMGLFMSGMEFTTGIMQLAVIAVGGWLIMCGEMDYVDLITFSLYVTSFVTPVRKLTQFSEMYMQEGIKLLKVNGVMPSNETIASGEYPYRQPFYAVIRADEPESSPARQLFNWLTTAEGKALIEKAGYVATAAE